MFGNSAIKKKNRNKTPIFLKDADIDKVLYLTRFPFVRKTVSTLLVTCI